MKVTLVLALILISGCMTEKITYVQNHKIMLDSNSKVKELIPAGHAEKIDSGYFKQGQIIRVFKRE